MKAVREVIEGAATAGVEILTLFAFSTENWQRPEEEVNALMTLLKLYVEQEQENLKDKGVEVHVLGELSRLDDEARAAVDLVQKTTAGAGRLRLNLMISYSGRSEIVNVARDLARRAVAGEITPDDIDSDAFSLGLSTAGLPDPDLLVRTSGEFRISNFMLWQLAYTEIFISPVLWPDFTREDLFRAIDEYQKRERRFGRVSAP
jgi:undecaprenyl diphosphate synthase